jgi:predicted amidophosphoribosyltransferase
VSGIALDTVSLQRVVKASTQTKKSRYERWKNVENSFLVRDPASFLGKHILLVDDVITTGSTIESCVNELIGSGAQKVSAAALAAALL